MACLDKQLGDTFHLEILGSVEVRSSSLLMPTDREVVSNEGIVTLSLGPLRTLYLTV